MNPEMVYRKRPNVVSRLVGEEILLVSLEPGEKGGPLVYSLSNRPAVAIWQCLDGINSAEQIAQRLHRDFLGDLGEIRRDMFAFLKEMERVSLIEKVGQ